MWNGNEDEEGLKEVFEKGEAIEGIGMNGGEFVGTKIHETENGKKKQWE